MELISERYTVGIQQELVGNLTFTDLMSILSKTGLFLCSDYKNSSLSMENFYKVQKMFFKKGNKTHNHTMQI